jgi:hypothetical protein
MQINFTFSTCTYIVSLVCVIILSKDSLMMAPGGDRNMSDYPTVVVIYNVKNKKSAFCWISIVCLISASVCQSY